MRSVHVKATTAHHVYGKTEPQVWYLHKAVSTETNIFGPHVIDDS